MIKQLVTETRFTRSHPKGNRVVELAGINFVFNNSGKEFVDVKVETSYPDNHPAFNLPERKEMVIGNKTYYWVGVPDTVVGGIMPQMEKKQSKKKKLFMKLKKEKLERIARYAAYVEKIDSTKLEKGELKRDKFYDLSSVTTDQDRVSASSLARLTKRDPIKILQRNNPLLLTSLMNKVKEIDHLIAKAKENGQWDTSEEIDEVEYQRIIRESVAEAS